MARLLLALFVVLNVTLKSTLTLVLETPRNGNVGISGGDIIPIEAAPYMAALFLENEQWCGATVIDDQFVLTAAHCLMSNNTEEWKILVGSDQLNTEGVFIDVEKILCHEKYVFPEVNHDICLLKLKENIPFECFWNIEKIALPENNRPIYEGELASVTGWGETGLACQVSHELRKALVPIVANECCRRVHPNVTDDMICAGDKHHNFCLGDAGGPLVIRNRRNTAILIGVASQDAASCRTYPGVYTRVASYLSWIQNTIQSNK
ncbi:trypsin-5-like [Cydia pomonella]|uniref:trypsin-5-like n=1 Tax=Cydia pomonella TaxID=82600 RepID=UPI002ADE3692|nr:trypsin-5-like [Cydia pomonella]